MNQIYDSLESLQRLCCSVHKQRCERRCLKAEMGEKREGGEMRVGNLAFRGGGDHLRMTDTM